MFDPNQYRNDCARLTLGAEKLEEIITMTENTKKKPMNRPMKTVLIIAACVAALALTAMAAPAVQQLFISYTITYRDSNSSTDFTVPSIRLEERDGRDILIVNDLETDVTDAFAKDGQYVANVEGSDITVTPDGWVEVIMATNEKSGPITYTFNLYSGDAVSSVENIAPETDALGTYIVTDVGGAIAISDYTPAE